MSGLYVLGGALLGAGLARINVADLSCWWSILFGMATVFLSAWLGVLSGPSRKALTLAADLRRAMERDRP